MESLKIRIVGAHEKPAWPDLDGVQKSKVEEVVIVEEATVLGNPSVGFRVVTPRGETVIFELTYGLFDGLHGAMTGVVARGKDRDGLQ